MCNIYIYIHINHTCILSIYINTSKKQFKQGNSCVREKSPGAPGGSGWGGITNYLQGNFFFAFSIHGIELLSVLRSVRFQGPGVGMVWENDRFALLIRVFTTYFTASACSYASYTYIDQMCDRFAHIRQNVH